MRNILNALILLLFSGQAYAEQKSLLIDGPGQSNSALFVQEVLEIAYQQLGYDVKYLRLPLARSFVEANEGRLDGLRFRVDSTEEKYSNLIAVPFPLLEFDVVLIADRRKCGMCKLEHLQNIATIRGLKAVEDVMASARFKALKLNVRKYTNVQQAMVLLHAQKIDGVIMTDIDFPDELSKNKHYLIKQSLSRRTDYHYLNKKHLDLVQPLFTVLMNMQETGKISALRGKYGIDNIKQDVMANTLGQVSAISDSWEGVTDTDYGAYWRLLRDIYQEKGNSFTHQVSNWKRAKAKFKNGDVDILVGAYAHEVDETMLLSDLHIDYEASVHAISADQDKLNKLLTGEMPGTGCYVIGYDFDRFIPSTIGVHEAPTSEDCERLLKAGRVDMIIGYEMYMSEEVRRFYVQKLILDAQPLFVVFHNTEKGKLIRDIFEKNFRQLLNEGKLADYYKLSADQVRSNLMIQPSQ